jgi:transcriptional regulator with XRE-family HTH domain
VIAIADRRRGEEDGTVGSRLRELRQKRNLTQEDVAKAIPMSQSAYNRYEKDQIHRFSKKTMERLAEILQATPEYILSANPNVALNHLPDYLRTFIVAPDAKEYLAKAFLDYMKDKVTKDINK